MVFNCDGSVTCLGVESKTSKRGNAYLVAYFLKGVETLSIMLPAGSVPPETGKNYNLQIDYDCKWGKVSLKSFNLSK